MTRVKWFFVLALVSATSYGLVQAEQPVRGEQLEAAQSASLPATPAPATPTPALPTLIAAAPTTVPVTATASIAWTPTPTPTTSQTPVSSPTATADPTSTPIPTDAPTLAPSPPLVPPVVNTHPEEPRSIFIDQYNQRLLVFEHGELVRDIPCSTGLPESDKYTPTAQGRVGQYWGTFTSFGVDADDAWYLFKSSGSILIHSLPYIRDEQGVKVYQDRDALGVRPASHGCIRIAPEDAVWLTAWNPEGALFEVTEPYLQKWFAPQ